MPGFRRNPRFAHLTNAQKTAEYDRACNHILGKNRQIQSLKYALMCSLQSIEEERWNQLPLRPNVATMEAQLAALQNDILRQDMQPVDLGCAVCKVFYNDADEPRRRSCFGVVTICADTVLFNGLLNNR